MSQTFINHGLGMMTQKEHDRFVNAGAVVCHGDRDAIVCDYPKLMIKRSGGEVDSVDMGGNYRNIMFEKESLEKQGKIVFVEWFPRKYLTMTKPKREEDREAIAALINSV